MRYGIFSDIHGNSDALQAVLAALEQEAVDRIICAGDIVGYGGAPHECLELCRHRRIPSIAGNHDRGACGLSPEEKFNVMARAALHWTQEYLSSADIHFLTRLPLLYQDARIVVVHGTLDRPDDFHYLQGTEEARKMFPQFQQNICFVGHTHVPGVFLFRSGKAENLESFSVRMDKDSRLIVNVGSVGQPRDRDPRAAYCIYDVEKQHVEIKRIAYNIMGAQQKIRTHGLPDYLAQRLMKGL